MVTVGFIPPRTRSVLLSGGKTDGASGPGVGSVLIFVHAGGVGMMIFGVGEAPLVVATVEVPHAEIKTHNSMNEEKTRMMDSGSGVSHFAI